MRFLFDENISFRIVKNLGELFLESKHVSDFALERVTDRKIWNYAKENQYTIVTFDADYYDLNTLYGHPPKVIWLRMGNTSTKNIATILEKHFEIIEAFLTDEKYKDVGCFEIDR